MYYIIEHEYTYFYFRYTMYANLFSVYTVYMCA